MHGLGEAFVLFLLALFSHCCVFFSLLFFFTFVLFVSNCMIAGFESFYDGPSPERTAPFDSTTVGRSPRYRRLQCCCLPHDRTNFEGAQRTEDMVGHAKCNGCLGWTGSWQRRGCCFGRQEETLIDYTLA